MPILLKNIEVSIISLFGGEGADDYTGQVQLITSVVGQIGIETYIELPNFIGLTQDFSKVIEAEFCSEYPTNIGVVGCTTHTELEISY